MFQVQNDLTLSPSRTIRQQSRQRKARRGAFTVEFALCCGLFFMIMMAGIEFARFMYARHSVDQAAYEAARLGILPGVTAQQVRTEAERILNATGIRNANVTVTPSTINSSTATVTVNIRASYSDNSWIGPLFVVDTDLVGNVTLDHENKAYLVTERNPSIGNNSNEPIDE